MRTKKRAIWVMLLVALLALPACGGDDDAASTTTADGVTPTEAPVTTEEGGATTTTTTTTAGSDAVEPVGTVVIGAPLDNRTFDPHASQTGPFVQYLTPLYDTLIRRTADLQLVPALATEWGYVDNENLVFELKLRDDVTFSDGTPLDAEAVKLNIEHGLVSTGPLAGDIAQVNSVAVVDPTTVQLMLSTPSPTLDVALTGPMGMMVNPSYLNDESLQQQPYGSGAYVMSDETQPGQLYVYEARDGYWNPDAFGPARIELRVMTDSEARLNALRSGEIDLSIVFPPQAAAAEEAGITLVHAPVNFYGLALWDREGEIVPALGDVRVRQALNYAVDREAVVAATTFGYGLPYAQIFPPDSAGDSSTADSVYSYDPEKARQLLADAGYADGFVLPVVTEARFSTYVEALDGFLREIGVQLDIQTIDSGLIETWGTKDYPAAMILYGVATEYQAMALFTQPDSAYNPFGTGNDRLVELFDDAAFATDDAAKQQVYQEASEIVTDDAWFLVTHFADSVYGVNEDRVIGVEAYVRNSMPYVYGWKVVNP